MLRCACRQAALSKHVESGGDSITILA